MTDQHIYIQPKIPLIPISSLPFVVENRKEYRYLRNSLCFSTKIEAGWISYNPNKLTVLSNNESFDPLYPTPNIIDLEKQIIHVTNQHELRQLEFMFTKPALMCATRRQTDGTGLEGFDTDFVLVSNPLDPLVAHHFQTIKDYVRRKIKDNKKFFITIDFSHVLNDILPWNFKRYVFWFNTEFYVTNHCKPNPFLSLDTVIACCIMTPVALLVSLPYKVYRKSICQDETFQLDVRLSLEYNDHSPLILHFFTQYVPVTRQRKDKYKNEIFSSLCSSTELRTLIDMLDETEERRDEQLK